MDDIWIGRAERILGKVGGDVRQFGQDARILALLLEHGEVSAENMRATVPSADVLKTRLCGLRAALMDRVQIETRYTDGSKSRKGKRGAPPAASYAIDPAGRAALIALAGPDPAPPPTSFIPARREWGLTRTQTDIAERLINTPLLARPLDAADALYVHICHIRKRLVAFGIEIETVWGRGWRLSEVSRARLAGKAGARAA